MLRDVSKLNQFDLESYQCNLDVLVNKKEAYNEAYDKFRKDNQSLIDDIEALRLKLGAAKDTLKELGEKEFIATNNKQLIGGLGIRVGTVLSYDDVLAFDWAKEHKLCLKLDSRAFDKIAKTQEIAFVDKSEKVTVTFPKAIKF